MKLSRRRLLQSGIASAALPLLESTSSRAYGQTPATPKRLIVFFHPNGTHAGAWFPTAGSTPDAFTLNRIHADPLAAHKSDLVFFRGIDMKCTALGPGEPHQRGMAAFLSGRHLLEGGFVGGDGSLAGWGSGITLDQRVAQALGQGTKFGSLELGIRATGGEVRHRISYTGANQPLPPQNDPRLVFNSMFSNLGTPGEDAARLRRRRASVLDGVRNQFSALSTRLSSVDRQKLEQHLTLVRDLETRIAAGDGTASAACNKPGTPPALNTNSEATMEQISRLQIDLTVMAMACDLTRVASLQYSNGQNHIVFPWVNSPMDGHALSHVGNTDPAREQIVARDRWYAGEFAYLLARLKSIPEGNGTMLDHTLVLWGNELAEGNSHSHANMPFVVAGRAGGLRTGRYLQYNGVSHNNLLVSLLNLLGIPDTRFGNPDFCTGPLSGFA